MNNDISVLIIEQAFGIIALLFTVWSMQLEKKRAVMITQTLSEVFIVLQYWIKGAFTGSAMAVVSFVRDLIFMCYGHRRAPWWILATLYAVMTLLTSVSWHGAISLLPFVGSLIYAFTLWWGNVKWIKFGNAVGNSPYLIYTFLTGNYALFMMTLLEVISAIIGFWRDSDEEKKANSQTSALYTPAR